MKKSTHTSDYAALRSVLRKVREAASLSQRDLAIRLDVAHSWVAKVEAGERRIDFVEYCWFLAACGADPLETSAPLFRKVAEARPSKAGKRGDAK